MNKYFIEYDKYVETMVINNKEIANFRKIEGNVEEVLYLENELEINNIVIKNIKDKIKNKNNLLLKEKIIEKISILVNLSLIILLLFLNSKLPYILNIVLKVLIPSLLTITFIPTLKTKKLINKLNLALSIANSKESKLKEEMNKAKNSKVVKKCEKINSIKPSKSVKENQRAILKELNIKKKILKKEFY